MEFMDKLQKMDKSHLSEAQRKKMEEPRGSSGRDLAAHLWLRALLWFSCERFCGPFVVCALRFF